VQFEKDVGNTADPFGIDTMIQEVTGGQGGGKKHGLQGSEERGSKRARVEDDDR